MKNITLLIALSFLTACTSLMEKRDDRLSAAPVGHLDTAAPTMDESADIPPVVQQVPIIAAPEPAEPLQTFTVVATDLPAADLLFALARDARLNLDIDPSIDGRVSINAIDQTLPQILKRISRQVALRFYVEGPNLVVEQDRPFVRNYAIDYLNMSRSTSTSIEVATQIATVGSDGGSGGSNSEASVSNESNNDFWASLEANIELMASVGDITGSVISNRESGTISVYTTAAAHEDIQSFVDAVIGSARRQVLIEATVVEVTLNDEFQGGVDWARIAEGDGWSLQQSLLGSNLSTSPFTSASYSNSNSERSISAAIKALDVFGEVSVMSSPKVMALNNQTSVLKVVDNVVYFTSEIEETEDEETNEVTTTIENTVHTVPVGFVMNVTPFITAGDEVILNIRPTISRILRFVAPPSIPSLSAGGDIELGEVPEIQVREMESVLRVSSGSTAVLGGLMQDTASKNDQGIPGLHDQESFGILFGSKEREFDKTELVIFLRPRVIDNASLDGSLRDYRKFLRPDAFSQN